MKFAIFREIEVENKKTKRIMLVEWNQEQIISELADQMAVLRKFKDGRIFDDVRTAFLATIEKFKKETIKIP